MTISVVVNFVKRSDMQVFLLEAGSFALVSEESLLRVCPIGLGETWERAYDVVISRMMRAHLGIAPVFGNNLGLL